MVLSAEEEHLPVGRHRRPEPPGCGPEPRHEGGVVPEDGQRLDAVYQRVFENPEVALQAPVRPAPLSPPVRRRNGPGGTVYSPGVLGYGEKRLGPGNGRVCDTCGELRSAVLTASQANDNRSVRRT